MTCRDIESLILAERDDALTPTERAALSDHVAACPACQQLRTQLATSLEAYRAGVASVPVPDVDEAWRDLSARLHEPAKPAKKRPLAPVIWFGAPLVAAAAAVAFVFLVNSSPQPVAKVPMAVAAVTAAPPPPPSSAPYDPSIIAGADYVEAGDPNASTMVYVDKESGWLVVWATDIDTAPTSG
jgi:Putative zinc-finger